MEFIIVNGEIVEKEEANLTSFFWHVSIPLSQKMWYGFGGIPLFSENLNSIIQQLELFGTKLPEVLLHERELFRITKRMLNKNKFYRSGIILFQFYISKTEINYVIKSSAFSGFDFPISEKGILVHFSDFKNNSQNPLQKFSFSNHATWSIEEAKNEKIGMKNSIFLNEHGKVCNGIASNIFMIKDNVLFTPALKTGCYFDNLTPFIIESAKRNKIKVFETDDVGKEILLEMTEIFLASEARGIEWILGINKKRFVHRHSLDIHKKLNKILKGDF